MTIREQLEAREQESLAPQAKVSIVSSAMIGTVSGSSVANVVVDGVFNIPMMKASGFRSTVAGAIEAGSVARRLMHVARCAVLTVPL